MSNKLPSFHFVHDLTPCLSENNERDSSEDITSFITHLLKYFSKPSNISKILNNHQMMVKKDLEEKCEKLLVEKIIKVCDKFRAEIIQKVRDLKKEFDRDLLFYTPKLNSVKMSGGLVMVLLEVKLCKSGINYQNYYLIFMNEKNNLVVSFFKIKFIEINYDISSKSVRYKRGIKIEMFDDKEYFFISDVKKHELIIEFLKEKTSDCEFSNLIDKNKYVLITEKMKELFGCKSWGKICEVMKINKNKCGDFILDERSFSGLKGVFFGFLFNDFDIVKCYRNKNGEIGCLFEQYENFYNKMSFIDSNIVGGNNSTNGADLIVNGNPIQLKTSPSDIATKLTETKGINKGNYRYVEYTYHNEGREIKCMIDKKTHNPCFIDKSKKLVIIDIDDMKKLKRKNMDLLVPKDLKEKYEEALKKKGWDVNVKESRFSSDQLKAMSKPLNMRSLMFDIMYSIPYAVKMAFISFVMHFGLDFLIQLITNLRNGQSLKKAIINSFRNTSFFRSIIAGLKSAVASGATVIIRGQAIRIIKELQFINVIKEILENAKLSALSTAIVFNGVLFAVDLVWDFGENIFKFFTNRISFPQFKQNMINSGIRLTISYLVGGAAGFLFGMLFGVPGAIIGSSVAGIGLLLLVKYVEIGYFHSDEVEFQSSFDYEIKRIFEEDYSSLILKERKIILERLGNKRELLKRSSLKHCRTSNITKKDEREAIQRDETKKMVGMMVIEVLQMRKKLKLPDPDYVSSVMRDDIGLFFEKIMNSKEKETHSMKNEKLIVQTGKKPHRYFVFKSGSIVYLFSISGGGNSKVCGQEKSIKVYDVDIKNNLIVFYSNLCVSVRKIDSHVENKANLMAFTKLWKNSYSDIKQPKKMKFLNYKGDFCFYYHNKICFFQKKNDKNWEITKTIEVVNNSKCFFRDHKVISVSPDLLMRCYDAGGDVFYETNNNTHNTNVLNFVTKEDKKCISMVSSNCMIVAYKKGLTVVSVDINNGKREVNTKNLDEKFEIVPQVLMYDKSHFFVINQFVRFFKILDDGIHLLWKEKINFKGFSSLVLWYEKTFRKSMGEIPYALSGNVVFMSIGNQIWFFDKIFSEEHHYSIPIINIGLTNEKKCIQVVNDKLIVLSGKNAYISHIKNPQRIISTLKLT